MLCLRFSRSNFNNTQYPNIFLRFWFHLKLLLQSCNAKSMLMLPWECLEHVYLKCLTRHKIINTINKTTMYNKMKKLNQLWGLVKIFFIPQYVILDFDDTLLNFLRNSLRLCSPEIKKMGKTEVSVKEWLFS